MGTAGREFGRRGPEVGDPGNLAVLIVEVEGSYPRRPAAERPGPD
jgi:hypothetical protein